MTEPTIRRVAEQVVFQNGFATLWDDEVVWPSGRKGNHLRLLVGSGSLGVVIIPRHQGNYGLVRTYRYPLGRAQWGFPRGMAQSADPLVTAAGELMEEMGIQASSMKLIGGFTPDSGVQQTQVSVVLAEVENPEGRTEDVDEVSDTIWLTPSELLARLGAEDWDDGMTMAALALLGAKEQRR